MKDYYISIFFSEKDKCYVANVPELRYCSAFGDTPEEALREVLIAKKEWLAVAKKTGKRIPRPTPRPALLLR